MSNYTIAVAWSGKDALSDSNPAKVISGSDFNTEFTAVQTAVNTKAELNGSASEAFSSTTATAGTNTTQVATTAFVTSAVATGVVDCLREGDLLDEDDMVSNSDTAIATQQSTKAYVDNQIASNITYASIVANKNDGSSTITLALPAGTWMVRADFTYHQSSIGGSSLTIDGSEVSSSTSQGDEQGTSQDVLFGYKSCTGGHTITCSATTNDEHDYTTKRFMVMAWRTA